MPATSPRVETFVVEDGHFVRKVVPRRGEPYEHRCPLDAYRELAWAAIDLAADGFTVETLADQVRSRPREERDDREPWASYTNAAVAIALWKEHGLLDVRRRRNYVHDGFFLEDAMIEFHALAFDTRPRAEPVARSATHAAARQAASQGLAENG